ncbi:MAG: AMP-binding protein [Aquamicrobium sp.]|uniref:class I adenylate-forming enzyme family protein n=1 Tax=Aquamicrobium sp. TaxID=1872579 RepID=UPI00349E8009|nr:AMP-binding protein [Aquamicrobium sp.]MCO5159256.1 AMP-binding protein [Aquamicrobium sp.]
MIQSPLRFNSVYQALLDASQGREAEPAVWFDGVWTSRRGLLDGIDRTVRHLRRLGVGTGDRFAFFGHNSLHHLLLYYAAAKFGAVVVPLNPNLTGSEIAYAVNHSRSKVLFHDAAGAEIIDPATCNVPRVPVGTIDQEIEGDASAAAVADDADFLDIYTSGSTGVPKAVMLGQGGQAGVPRSLARMWGITEADTTLVALPMGYLYGLSTAAAVALQTGGKVVILRRFHSRDVLEAMAAHRITVFHGVPTMYNMMISYAGQNGLEFDLSHVRVLITSGAPTSAEALDAFERMFGARLQNYFALSEATPAFGRFHDDPRPLPPGSAGLLAPEAEASIRLSDGTETPEGGIGELYLRTAGLMLRYDGAPEMTAENLQDGYFRTGDLVRRDAEGFYYIVGRSKDMIIRGGANISPIEVENVLTSDPAVDEAAVVGAADPIYGEVAVGFVTLHAGKHVDPAALIALVAGRLSDFKVPRSVTVLAEMPYGKTGKIDKAALRKLANGG